MREFFKGTLKFFLWVAAFLAIVLGFIRYQYIRTAVIAHNGMAPTLFAGDQVLIWKRTPDVGDVTICAHPRLAGRFVIGRIIATAGMRVENFRNLLRVDGDQPEREVLGEVLWHDFETNRNETMIHSAEDFTKTRAWKTANLRPHHTWENKGKQMNLRGTTVKAGFYLLGDNRTYRGEDSRTFGEVVPRGCWGDVFMRWKPSDIELPEGVSHGWFSWVP